MENVDFEIETLISSTSGLHNEDVVDVLHPRFTPENEENGWQAVANFTLYGKTKGNNSEKWRLHRQDTPIKPKESIFEATSVDKFVEDFVVNGSEIKDLPTQYDVKGLQSHEVPVIGTYVAKSVVPGFRYLVRMLGTGRYLFEGKPMLLERIGMGYGKRLTFRGECLNNNSNYFWSDSLPEGYGFGIHILDVGTKFDICDVKDRFVGTATVESVDSKQQEVFSRISNGAVEKHVSVRFTCTVQYGADAHGLMSLLSRELVTLQGVAVVTKAKRADPVIKSIVSVSLPYLGMCAFYPSEM